MIPVFLNCSTCFGRQAAHHQELKNCNYSLWFCIRVWLPAVAMAERSGWQPKTYVKPETAITLFELLMMGGLSPETCWAIKKHWNNEFYYTVASCWFFLWDLYYDPRIHEHQVIQDSWYPDRNLKQVPPNNKQKFGDVLWFLTLILLTWRIGWALNNASKWQMGFNLAFKRLTLRLLMSYIYIYIYIYIWSAYSWCF